MQGSPYISDLDAPLTALKRGSVEEKIASFLGWGGVRYWRGGVCLIQISTVLL